MLESYLHCCVNEKLAILVNWPVYWSIFITMKRLQETLSHEKHEESPVLSHVDSLWLILTIQADSWSGLCRSSHSAHCCCCCSSAVSTWRRWLSHTLWGELLSGNSPNISDIYTEVCICTENPAITLRSGNNRSIPRHLADWNVMNGGQR